MKGRSRSINASIPGFTKYSSYLGECLLLLVAVRYVMQNINRISKIEMVVWIGNVCRVTLLDSSICVACF